MLPFLSKLGHVRAGGTSSPAGPYVLRKGTSADTAAVVELHNAANAHWMDAGDLHQYAKNLRIALVNKHQRVIVAEAPYGAGLAGFAVILPPDSLASSTARLAMLVVDLKYRRKGLGRRLIGAAESYAQHIAAHRLQLEVNERNMGAISLYTQLGYKVGGREPAAYSNGDGALQMQKPLPAPTGLAPLRRILRQIMPELGI